MANGKTRPAPVPFFRIGLSVELNGPMAEELLNFFDQCQADGKKFPTQVWAFYKRLESWMGSPTDDDDPDLPARPK